MLFLLRYLAYSVCALGLLRLCLAHVEFAFDTDAAGDDGFLTWLKVPHGCILAGPDNGDAPVSDTEAMTSALQITVPAVVPTVVAGVLTGWNLSRSLQYDPLYQNNITTFTYTATQGSALVQWQALAVPFIFTTPDTPSDLVIYMPTVQFCLGGYVTYWNTTWDPTSSALQPPHPSPTLIILGSNDSAPAPSSSTTVINTTSGSSRDEALGIVAIVLAAIALLGCAFLLILRYVRPAMARDAGDKSTQLTSSYAPNRPSTNSNAGNLV